MEAGASVVVVDAGFAKVLDITNLTQDVYAMPFGQNGLSLEGCKISRIRPRTPHLFLTSPTQCRQKCCFRSISYSATPSSPNQSAL